MNFYSVPEMKLYKRRMVSNIIRDVQQQKQDDIKKWELTLQAVKNFDDNMTLENFDILALCKGSRTPVHIGEKIKFAILAEDYLRKHLQLVLIDDMTVPEQADIHHEIWKKTMEMRKIDYPRTLDLQANFRDVTNFTKLGENQYVVSIYLLVYILNDLNNFQLNLDQMTVERPKTAPRRVNPMKEVKKLSAAACDDGPKVS